jgi:hypothetical protein
LSTRIRASEHTIKAWRYLLRRSASSHTIRISRSTLELGRRRGSFGAVVTMIAQSLTLWCSGPRFGRVRAVGAQISPPISRTIITWITHFHIRSKLFSAVFVAVVSGGDNGGCRGTDRTNQVCSSAGHLILARACNRTEVSRFTEA